MIFIPAGSKWPWLDLETGETGEAKLEHGNGEAERWYRQLAGPALIGLEATGNCEWFVELVQKYAAAVLAPLPQQTERRGQSRCRA